MSQFNRSPNRFSAMKNENTDFPTPRFAKARLKLKDKVYKVAAPLFCDLNSFGGYKNGRHPGTTAAVNRFLQNAYRAGLLDYNIKIKIDD